jgi:hypothetical protein
MKSERWNSVTITNNSRSEENITCVEPNIFCKFARSRLDLVKKTGSSFWQGLSARY